jgi:hypothetical protein
MGYESIGARLAAAASLRAQMPVQECVVTGVDKGHPLPTMRANSLRRRGAWNVGPSLASKEAMAPSSASMSNALATDGTVQHVAPTPRGRARALPFGGELGAPRSQIVCESLLQDPAT